ncbi:apolipoprotein N-acyltransferase [Candidatus Poribacteria bacterium]|nr:apolipoprotein N-acyltransferase [Candidatus Poribacteria bacterium]
MPRSGWHFFLRLVTYVLIYRKELRRRRRHYGDIGSRQKSVPSLRSRTSFSEKTGFLLIIMVNRELNGWRVSLFQIFVKPWMLAILSGIFLVLSLPSFNLSFLAWIALVPLLIVIQNVSVKTAFGLGLVTGIFYFLGMTYWIIPLAPYANIAITTFAALLLTGYLCVYVGCFVVLLKVGITVLPLSKKDAPMAKLQFDLVFIFLAPIIWTALELIRSWLLTGFPWGSIGYSQWNNLPAIQIASSVGVYGISFIVVLVNAAIARFILVLSEWRRGLYAVILPAVILIAIFTYGFIQLAQSPSGQKLKIAIVPGNIPQMEKWKGDNLNSIFNKYVKTTERLAGEKLDLIVWPETCIPANLLIHPMMFNEVKSTTQLLQAPLLFGIPYYDDNKIYNAVFLLSSDGAILGKYYKIHLVPFGEYTPHILKQMLPEAIREKVIGVMDFDKGETFTLFPLPSAPPSPPRQRGGWGGDIRADVGSLRNPSAATFPTDSPKFGIVICFESAFPGFFRKFVKSGANFMGVVTNDAWFTGTAAPEQHFTMSVFRAIENRVSLFHAANGGISAIIDRFGQISPKVVKYPENDFIIGEIYLSQEKTFYTRHGDWLPQLCLLLTGGVVLLIAITLMRET